MKVISCHSQRRIFLNEKKRMSNFSLVFDFVVFITVLTMGNTPILRHVYYFSHDVI